MALIFITHDMGVVAEIADRVVVMREGRKVEEGPVEPIFAAPQHPYTRMLLAAVPVLGSLSATKLPVPFPAGGHRRRSRRTLCSPARRCWNCAI